MEVQDGLSKHDFWQSGPQNMAKLVSPRGVEMPARRACAACAWTLIPSRNHLEIRAGSLQIPIKTSASSMAKDDLDCSVKWKINESKVCIDRNGLTNDHPPKMIQLWWHMWWCLVRHMFVSISQDLRSTGQPCCFFKRLLERNKGSLLGNLDHYPNVIGKNNNQLETTTPYMIFTTYTTLINKAAAFSKSRAGRFQTIRKKKLGGDVWGNWGSHPHNSPHFGLETSMAGTKDLTGHELQVFTDFLS